MKQCQQCGQEKSLDQFKLVSQRRVPMRFCLDCYTDNRRKSRTGEKPYDPKNCTLTRSYGITVEEYNRMLAKQEGRCAICKSTDPRSPKRINHWYVDHCHETGKVRGLLCNHCNRGLGLLGDNLANFQAAVDYLKNQ